MTAIWQDEVSPTYGTCPSFPPRVFTLRKCSALSEKANFEAKDVFGVHYALLHGD
jgi:hypothetical protein